MRRFGSVSSSNDSAGAATAQQRPRKTKNGPLWLKIVSSAAVDKGQPHPRTLKTGFTGSPHKDLILDYLTESDPFPSGPPLPILIMKSFII